MIYIVSLSPACGTYGDPFSRQNKKVSKNTIKQKFQNAWLEQDMVGQDCSPTLRLLDMELISSRPAKAENWDTVSKTTTVTTTKLPNAPQGIYAIKSGVESGKGDMSVMTLFLLPSGPVQGAISFQAFEGPMSVRIWSAFLVRTVFYFFQLKTKVNIFLLSQLCSGAEDKRSWAESGEVVQKGKQTTEGEYRKACKPFVLEASGPWNN